MKCKDCKHWNDTVFGVGNARVSWRICDVMGEDDNSVAIGTGYGEEASVATAPDFGCIQFEAK